MPPAIRVVPTNKKEAGPCALCEDDIEKGQLHATLCLSFGISKRGRRKFKSLHVHLNDCLAKWIITDLMRYREKVKDRKGGRPVGASIVKQQLEPEPIKQRHKLVRRYSWLFRKFLACEAVAKCDILVTQIKETKKQIEETGVPIGKGNKRSQDNAAAINAKWAEYHTGIAERRRDNAHR